jgi:hypothetical protein
MATGHDKVFPAVRLTEIAMKPLFTNSQFDPRWLPFAESIGKSPEQLAALRSSAAARLINSCQAEKEFWGDNSGRSAK